MRKLRSKTTVSKHDGGIMFVQVQCPECARRDQHIKELRAVLGEIVTWFDGRSPGFKARAKQLLFQRAAKLLGRRKPSAGRFRRP